MLHKVILFSLLIVPIFAWEASKHGGVCEEPEKKFEKISAGGDKFKTFITCWNIINNCTPTNEKEKEFIRFLDETQAKLEEELSDEAAADMERLGGYPVSNQYTLKQSTDQDLSTKDKERK